MNKWKFKAKNPECWYCHQQTMASNGRYMMCSACGATENEVPAAIGDHSGPRIPAPPTEKQKNYIRY